MHSVCSLAGNMMRCMFPRYRRRHFTRLMLLLLAFLFTSYLTGWTPRWMPQFKRPPQEFSREEMDIIKDKLISIASDRNKFPVVFKTDMNLNIDAPVSNRIGVYREIPDGRPDACKRLNYDRRSLPTASVIISYHNEIWSVIFRTVSSVFLRTPSHLLQEIILVDDASTFDFLGSPLDEFISHVPKTKVIRNPYRQGLIRTRMSGARAATGDVLIFLDAHIEVGVDWIEPLLQTLMTNRKLILSPAVEVIKYDTMKYEPKNRTEYSGGFKWTYEYIWKSVPDHIQSRRMSEADSVPTPTFVACAIAVERQFFFEIGAFDEDMQIWGGENLEISFRFWMCADGVQIIPCSHIGHVYRRFLPYGDPGTGVIQKNYQRSADVWMDEYAKFYYAASHRIYQYTESEKKSLEGRKELRRRLGCKSFQWYLDTVIPEMFVPWENATYQGQMTNLASGRCLQTNVDTGFLELAFCEHNRKQYFYLLLDQRLFYNYTHCLTPVSDTDALRLTPCHGPATFDQQWTYIKNIKMSVRKAGGGNFLNSATLVRLRSHINDGSKCLTQKTVVSDKQMGGLWHCDDLEKFAHWDFSYRMDFSVFDEPPIVT